jgi:hypothetical protein
MYFPGPGSNSWFFSVNEEKEQLLSSNVYGKWHTIKREILLKTGMNTIYVKPRERKARLDKINYK